MAEKEVSNKKTTKKAAGKTTVKKNGTKAVAKDKPVLKQAVLKKSTVKTVKRIPLETLDTRIIAPRKVFEDSEILEFKEHLMALRERLSGGYTTLKDDSLAANQRDPSLSDQGSDTFDREMELNMMGSEQEVIFEIDAALRRIEKGTFGICELTEDLIRVERLKALPYVRYTVDAQSQLEKGRTRFRPFGGTMQNRV